MDELRELLSHMPNTMNQDIPEQAYYHYTQFTGDYPDKRAFMQGVIFSYHCIQYGYDMLQEEEQMDQDSVGLGA